MGAIARAAALAALLAGPALGSPAAWVCPMDAEVRRSAPGRCPRCGMALVAGPLDDFAEYALAVEAAPRPIAPGRRTRITFRIAHPQTGAPVRDLALVHERPFHLFVVPTDLSSLDHLHPTPRPDGSLVEEVRFPRAGTWLLFADFVPEGGMPQRVARALAVGRGGATVRPARLAPDPEAARTIGATRIALRAPALVAGQEAAVAVRLTDAAGAAPVAGLEPWLGAFAHVLAVAEDLGDAVHAHAEAPAAPGELALPLRLPRAGRWRLWVQAKVRGEVLTAPFTVDVARRGARIAP